jgi:hypothetical protein
MSIYPGNLLTATAASVAGSPTPSRTWQWLRNGTAIVGETNDTYRLTYDDIGASVAAQQIETNVAGQRTATSLPVTDITEFDPNALFASGEAGDWFDPSDLSRMWQDTAGTTPVTADGQTAALMLGQRRGANVETIPSDLTAIFTSKTGFTVSPTSIVVNLSASDQITSANFLTQGSAYVVQFEVFDYATGTLALRFGNTGSTDATITANGVYTYTLPCDGTGVTFRGNISGTAQFSIRNISVKEVALTALTQSDAAKRPAYKTSGGLHWLQFDGSDDFISSPATLDLTAVDEATLCIGVSKESDAVEAHVFGVAGGAENGPLLRAPGSPTTSRFNAFSRGTSGANAVTTSASFNAPVTVVQTGISKISAPSVALRLNGALIQDTTTSQGTGTYGNRAVKMGGFASALQPFTGKVYFALIRGALTSGADLTALEGFAAAKTGVTI